jgi:hypothetical protein
MHGSCGAIPSALGSTTCRTTTRNAPHPWNSPRFRIGSSRSGTVELEPRAARVAGALLFALAAYVAITSVVSLMGYSEPKTTFLGIAILVAAAAVMPWLAKEKRRLSGATGSAALMADAAQSALCAYLSLIALAGLAINAIWHVKWADPIAALAVLPLIVWEGREAKRGKPKPDQPRGLTPYASSTSRSVTMPSNLCKSARFTTGRISI